MFILQVFRVWRAVMLPAAALVGLSIAPPGGAAQRYALAVGVSRYPKPLPQLEGPRNDVTLLVNTLVEAHWTRRDHIRVLADDLVHAQYPSKITADGAPTIAEIRSGFDWLLRTTSTGDEVIIYLSGHGSYVPALEMPGDAPEPDGVDEVFLPIDIGGWSDALHGLKNQLIDNEIGVFLGKMRAKGAKVWLIADSCNSGTLSRAGVTVKGVNPVAQLNVPARAFLAAAHPAPSSTRSLVPTTPPDASFVGFYAALSSLDAVEAQVPIGGRPSELRTHGLFTWYLVRAIRSGQTSSFERIAQTILAGYSEWRGAAPIPMFEGDLASPTFFDARGGRLYSLSSSGGKLAVKGGMLDGIDAGTRFDLIDLRGAAPKKIGTAHAIASAADQTAIEVDPAGSPADGRIADDIRTVPSGFGAQVTSLGISLRLSVALSPVPGNVPASDRTLHDRIAAELAVLLADPATHQRIALAPAASPETADVRLVVKGGRLFFAPPTGDSVFSDGTEPPSLEAADADTIGLTKMLGQIGHGRNLLRATELLKEAEISRNTRVRIYRSGQSRNDSRCPRHVPDQARASGSIAFDTVSMAGRIAQFVDCDLVTVAVTNTGHRSIGVTPLYLDSWAHIDFLPDYPESADSALVVDPGATALISYTETLPDGPEEKRSGLANLVLLMSVVDGAEPIAQDYRSLATGAPQPVRADILDPTSSNFLLAAAGAGGSDIRSAAGSDDTRTGAVVISLKVGKQP